MQKRYQYRTSKLPVYKALIDILAGKGENVADLYTIWQQAQTSPDEDRYAMQVFEKVASSMMQFDMGAIMQN